VDDVKDDCTPEYYDKPKLSGFFYTPRTDLIQKYSVKAEDEFGRPLGQEPIMPFTQDEFERPCCPPQTAVVVLENGCCSGRHCKKKKCSCRSSYQQEIVPQQAQIMYDMGDWRSNNKKTAKRQMNHYVQHSEVPGPNLFTDEYGDQYFVDGGQMPMQGMGDYGPPQHVEYVEYSGNVKLTSDGDPYSRKLPVQGGMGGRNFGGNFTLKQGDGYGGYGINMAALGIRDQY